MRITTRETPTGTVVQASGSYNDVYSWYLTQQRAAGPNDSVEFIDGARLPPRAPGIIADSIATVCERVAE